MDGPTDRAKAATAADGLDQRTGWIDCPGIYQKSGGESTTIAQGMERRSLYEPIRARAAQGCPILGTCAGAILLGRPAHGRPVRSLGLVDVGVVRNAYGTQLDSFVATADPGAYPGLAGLRCVFIRAPRFEEPGPGVEVLVRVRGSPVLLRQGRILASAFHPELTADPRVLHLLLEPLRETTAATESAP